MAITPFYAAILGLVFVVLSILTLSLRRKLKIPLGDGKNQQLLRAMRVHANFAEYVPLTLLLMYMSESQGAPHLLIHIWGIALLLGRFSHAYGVNQLNENYKFRVFGMAMTLTTIITSSIYLLFSYITKV